MIEEPTKLDSEVLDARRSITSDGYPMSVGELTTMYRDGELIIRPEFQRFFRWSQFQKSSLVESLMLGIPIPSIFVAQDKGGKWELVDGLQRISTILELQGELLDNKGEKKPELILQGTKYLPSLEGKCWSGKVEGADTLGSVHQLDIKRSKIDIKIIKRESSSEAKYDLFQRLNSYGSTLNAQEVRSALLVAVSPEFFATVERLASYANFVDSVGLSDRLIEERFDLELVLRFFILHNRPVSDLTLTALRDFPQVVDRESLALAKASDTEMNRLEAVFKSTFDIISTSGGDELFKKWDPATQQFKGSFLNTAFEVFALGLGYHIANRSPFKDDLITVAKSFWSNLRGGYATGRSTESRLVEFVQKGRELTAQ